MTIPLPSMVQQLIAHPQASRIGVWLTARRAVLLPLAFAGTLALAFGLGRHSDGAPPAGDPSGAATGRAATSASPTGADRSQGVPISQAQLSRLGLLLVRPELSSGTERPISGFVEAAVGAQSSVGMPIAGSIVRLLVAPGQTVRTGQPLAVVSSPEAAVVRADVDAAQVSAESFELQYRRMLSMGRQGALTWQEVETQRVATLKARSLLRAALAKAKVIGSPDATGQLLLRSPISGHIAAVKASAGSVLQAGEPVAEIGDARGSELRFLVTPLLGGSLQAGQRLRVKAGQQDLRSRVIAVAPDATAEQRVMVVRAEAIEGQLPPAGTAVTAFVTVPSSERRFTLPTDAVQLRNGQPVVFRYRRGIAELATVVIGRRNGERVSILSGLSGDDLVLTGNISVLLSYRTDSKP
jgi:cobalt-zinc-cadmium efflux system membrane fusion protein